MSAEPQEGPIESDGERDAPRTEAADVPHGDAAKALPPCDLVMKGGITSGVVYPGLVQQLATKYRFASIGGTSAGAIAAGVCAAAEYARQGGDATAMARLGAIMADLGRPGFLLGLFQPTPGARRLFDLLTSAMSPRITRVRRGERLLVAAAQLRWEVALGAVVVLAGLGTLTVASFGALPAGLAAALAVLIALPLAGLVMLGAGLLAFGLVVARGVRSRSQRLRDVSRDASAGRGR
jgi:patatin-like phospholipase